MMLFWDSQDLGVKGKNVTGNMKNNRLTICVIFVHFNI